MYRTVVHVAALSLVPVRAGASTGCCEKEEQGEGQGRRAGQRAVSWARGGEASGGERRRRRRRRQAGGVVDPFGPEEKETHPRLSLSQLCTKRFT